MNKEEFLNSLEEIVNDKIYLTEKIDEIENEINQNHWSFSINDELSNQIKIDELESIISRVKESRIKQLNKSRLKIDLNYYSWYDAQSGNFNFNLINYKHSKLPFSSQYELIDSEKDIIEGFLKDTFNTPLLVYQEILKTKHNKG